MSETIHTVKTKNTMLYVKKTNGEYFISTEDSYDRTPPENTADALGLWFPDFCRIMASNGAKVVVDFIGGDLDWPRSVTPLFGTCNYSFDNAEQAVGCAEKLAKAAGRVVI